MNCSRARKWIALQAGADLPARKARRLEQHLGKCPICRAEMEEHRAVLDAVRDIAGRETLDWTEAEWRSLIAQTTSGQPEPARNAPLAVLPRKAWVYGLAALLVFGISALILSRFFSPTAAPRFSEFTAATPAPPSRFLPSDTAASAAPARDVPFLIRWERSPSDRTMFAARPAAQKSAQDILSMTLVSQETGLKVHWTFNKNFVWEEIKK